MRSAKVNVGDSGLASQYNNLRADAYAASILLPHQQSSPGLTLYIEAGVCYIGGTQVVFAGGNSPTFTAPTTNPRIDILTIDSAGTLAITQGTENASPVAPAYPADKIVLCEVYNRVSETALYDTDPGGSTGYIKRDVRPIVQLGGYIASSSQIAVGALTGDKFASLASIPGGAGLIPAANLPPLVSFFGDGSDGAVTISGNTTLSRDMYYSTLTINGGITLNTNGYRVFVSGTLTNNGTIANNGGNGGTPTAGSGAPAGTLPGGVNGPTGASGGNNKGGGGGGGGGIVAIYAYNIVNNGTIQANGGNGGNGLGNQGGVVNSANGVNGNNANPSEGANGGGGGGYNGSTGNSTGGVATATAVPDLTFRFIVQAYLMFDFVAIATIKGGASGGSGGATNSGGGGAGGGGGGGGGFVLIVYHTASFGTEQANGGSLGSGNYTGGQNGSNGSNGKVLKVAV